MVKIKFRPGKGIGIHSEEYVCYITAEGLPTEFGGKGDVEFYIAKEDYEAIKNLMKEKWDL